MADIFKLICCAVIGLFRSRASLEAEILTLRQTGKMSKNLVIVLFGTQYWEEVVNFEALVRHGTIDRKDLDLFHRTDSVEEAFQIITTHLEEHALAERGAFL